MAYICWNTLWNYSEPASLGYALTTRLMGRGWPVFHPADAFVRAADRVLGQLRAHGLSARVFWEKFFAALRVQGENAPQNEPTRALADVLRGDDESAGLSDCLREFGEQWRRVFPGGAHELELRSRPLRELWEARATGLWQRLLRELGQPSQWLPHWKVFWTFPVCGGYGFVLPEEECLFMEAVLVNPQAELPETVRLAWLLGHQLLWQWLDRTQVRPETARAVSLALLGPVLEAARYVEWLGGDAPSVHEVAPLWMDRPITAREYRCLEELWNGPKDPDALLAGVAALEKAIACSDAEPAEDGGG